MNDIAIRVEKLSKRYRIGGVQTRYRTMRDSVASAFFAPFRRTIKLLRGEAYGAAGMEETIWALKEVSLTVRRGEIVGVIGRNGAGKTTLLKILSRITEPTKGYAEIHGRVGSLLEVGTGFHHELTGRENVYLNGAILGMRKSEIDRKFDEIVAFSEVERFLDTPVKFYSSGMRVRLAFAVAAHLEPEILMVDEVLAVGDAAFQKKCLGKMGDVAKGGKTVLFVSHNMGAINQLCPMCVWLDGGMIKDMGETSAIVSAYVKSMETRGSLPEVDFAEDLAKEAQLRRVKLLNAAGDVTQKFQCDEPVIIELLFQVRRTLPGLYGYLQVSRTDGTRVLVSDSYDTVPNPIDGLPVGLHTINITVPPRTLAPGDYTVYLNFTSQTGKNFNVDSPGIVCSFSLDDFASRRGNKRGGYFSTLLPWRVRNSSA